MGAKAEPVSAVFLIGPTASGKTELAVKLVQKYPLKIISVDSALVYRGMDIGTAKPDAETLALAPHRLIDIRPPQLAYSAADFCTDALTEIEQIKQTGHIPLLVGGTMLYYQALQQGLSPLPKADPAVRHHLEQQAQQLGWIAMHEKLQAIDAVAAARIHSNDPQRIQRALEVYLISGKTMTELYQSAPSSKLTGKIIKLGLMPSDRSILHKRIETRFEHMLQNGFEQEVRDLLQLDGMHTDLPAMRSVGYRQMCMYIAHQYTQQELLERGIIATRQLAKRQMTWMRGWQDLLIFTLEHKDLDEQIYARLDKLLLRLPVDSL